MTGDERIEVQKVGFLNIDVSRALEIVGVFTEGPEPRTVGFVNAHCVNVARSDPEYRRIINGFDAVLPDGIGLDLAARLKGIRIKENLNGTDLSPRIFEWLAKRKKSVFLLGGKPGVADRAAEVLSERYEGLKVCGWSHGYEVGERAPEIFRAIREADPDVIVVSMGTPLQEKWIDAHKGLFGKRLFLSVGGLLDFISGVYPRAPLWVRKIKMEWFFRMCFNPKHLWKRYLIGNQVFLFYAILEAFAGRKTQGPKVRQGL